MNPCFRFCRLGTIAGMIFKGDVRGFGLVNTNTVTLYTSVLYSSYYTISIISAVILYTSVCLRIENRKHNP